MVELGQRLREQGEPHPGARAWTLKAPEVDRVQALQRLQGWLGSHPERVPRRCGVASVTDSERGEAIAVVAVPVLADLSQSMGAIVVPGRWVTVDVLVYNQATAGSVVVLGPRGAPRTIPSSFDPDSGRVLGRFMADREGPWFVQVVATTAAGPKPVIELQLHAGDKKAESSSGAPGEEAGQGLSDEQAVVAMLNAAREREGLRPLLRDAKADEVAREHVKRMIAQGIVAHDAGDGSPPERAARAGISSSEVGENVSRAASTKLVHRALWNSPSHRANTLHPRYERVGVGAVRDERGVLWVAQLFVGR